FGQYVGDIGLRVDAVQLAGLDQRGQAGPVLGTGVVAGEECIFAIESNRSHRTLDRVGVDLDPAVLEKAFKPVPVIEAVADGAGNRRFGGGALELRLQPALQLDDQRLAFRLTHRSPLGRGARADYRLELI